MRFDDIQKTFVISLPGSPRRAIVKEEMAIQSISFEFWDGIEDKQDGANGLKKTFKRIFETCLMKGHNTVAIFEDDVKFLIRPSKLVMDYVMSDLPDNFHLCKFGANLLMPPIKGGGSAHKLTMSYALHAVLYSREGMKEILNWIESPEPLDVIIAKKIEPLGKCYVSSKMIATQHPLKSSIFVYDPKKHNKAFTDKYLTDDGVIRWDIFMQEQWDKNTKHIV